MPHRLRIEDPPDPPPPPKGIVTIGTVKSLFEASWKVLPVLWFAFQFYANQNTIAEKTDSNRKAIEKLQTDSNKLSREVTKTAATVEAMKQIQDNDRLFFLQTTPPPRHR
jgi:fructoselysine-6-P-deglycase FrlB-like protein